MAVPKALHLMALQLALTALLLARSTAGIRDRQDYTATLTLAPQECSALQVDHLRSTEGFYYEAYITSVNVGAAQDTCSLQDVSLSKMYLRTGCVTDHTKVATGGDCDEPGGSIRSADNNTCHLVFTNGTYMSLASVNSGGFLDSGNVCSRERTAYIFASSNCSDSVQLSVVVQTAVLRHGYCLDGGPLPQGAIITIAIAVPLAFAALVFVVGWWLCMRRRRNKAAQLSAQAASLPAGLHHPYGAGVQLTGQPAQQPYQAGAAPMVAIGYPAVNQSKTTLPAWQPGEP